MPQEPGAIDLQWEADDRGVHGYLIEIAEGENLETAEFKPFASCTARKYRAQNLERGKFYAFLIRSIAAGATYSDASGVTCVTR